MKKLNVLAEAARLIAEAEAEEQQQELQQSDSLDVAVDKFLMSNEQQMSSVVGEAEEGEEEPAETPDAPDATPDTKLDAEKFASSVARLMQHYDDLIDIPNTIMRRALNYVTQNYDEQSAAEVKQILTKEFQLGPDVRNVDYDIQAPAADRAGPSGGGAPGA